MSREVRRVPEGFDWPLEKTWSGYFRPEFLRAVPCVECENGYSPEAERFHKEWYGNAPFDPASTGSSPFFATGDVAMAWAKRQTERSPEFYGTGTEALEAEARRITAYWNEAWSHHLSQEDVQALIDGDRLWDLTREFVRGEGWCEPAEPKIPTAAEVNVWSLTGFGHDSLNAYICIKARVLREGVPLHCGACGGDGYSEAFVGQRALADAWVPIEVPTGDAWQLWETVSEGSPVSPAFATPEELAEHISKNPRILSSSPVPITPEAALVWITESGWAPTAIFVEKS